VRYFAFRSLCCAVAGSILLSCGPKAGDTGPRTRVTVDGVAMSTGGQPEQSLPIERALRSDPVASQLHEISGAMLQYYALNGRLPPQLEDLQPLADVGRPLILESAATGKPFVYVPAGLQSHDDTRQIVLYDEKPAKSGHRWAILMQRPKGRQGAATWVVPLTESVFRTYAPPPARE
jgi:hypothetical protein